MKIAAPTDTNAFELDKHAGELILFYVLEVVDQLFTGQGTEVVAMCDLVIFTQSETPQIERNVLIDQWPLVRQLRSSVDCPPVLARLKRQTFTSTRYGGPPPRPPAYTLAPHSSPDAARVTSHLISFNNDPFNNAVVRLDSPIEEEFWRAHVLARRNALDGLVTQHPVLAGRYRLDFALPEKKIGIELDGYEYHSSRTAFTKDRERQRAIEAAGWRVIRFSGAEVNADPVACVRQAAELVTAFERS